MRHFFLCVSLISLACISATLFTAEANNVIQFHEGIIQDDDDRIKLEFFIQHAVNAANKKTAESVKAACDKSPESFAWVDFRELNCLLLSYQLTGNRQYLDLFAKTFALYRDIMTAEADEYLGWYGITLKNRQPKDNPEIRIDELQMTFRAISILSLWVELARGDVEYAESKKETITAYLSLMEDHLFPKWDARGKFYVIPGHGGVYQGLDFPLPQFGSLPWEKLSMMVDGCIKLYRVTGNAIYMNRAVQIGTWYKRNLQLIDGHYEWLSRVPAAQSDVDPNKENTWKGWIAPDPNAAWYVASQSIAMSLYQHGLLFTDTDIERFVKTQKEQCWNGDLEKPVYANVSGTTNAENKYVKGKFLSHELSRYDETLQNLAFTGPHEAWRLSKVESGWHGGTSAQGYVYSKYLSQASVDNRQPARAFGQKYLADSAVKTFYDQHFFEITEPGSLKLRSPNEWFAYLDTISLRE